MDFDSKTLLDQAVEYASLGWRTYPIQPPNGSSCTCRKGEDCSDTGKHPYYELGGMNAATTDPVMLETLFGTRESNLGLFCDGFFVLDVEANGVDALEQLTQANGAFPITPKASTGGGGFHYFFKDDPLVRKGKTRIRGLAIDTPRQVVAPPSIHKSGCAYSWLVSPTEQSLAAAPQWLISWLIGKDEVFTSSFVVADDNDLAEHPGVSEGERNTTLCRLVGGYLARYGQKPELLSLAIEWGKRCEPPYPEREVEKVVASLISKRNVDEHCTSMFENSLELTVRPFSEIQAKPIQWLWFGRLALGKITLLTGDGGVGKSMLTCDIAYRVTQGIDFSDETPCLPGEVFFIGAEDGAEDTIRPRLEAAGSDLSKVPLISGPIPPGEKYAMQIDLSRHLRMLDSLLDQYPEAKLLVIDPIMDFLGPATNSDKATDVRRVLSPLRELAEKHSVAIIAMSHLNKSGKGPKTRSLGSGAFVQVARVELRVHEDPSDQDRRLLLPVKNNLGKAEGLAYRIEPWEENPDIGKVCWEEGTVDISIHDIENDDRKPKKLSAKSNAKKWLLQLLEDGRVAASEIENAAKEDHGLSWRTVERARSELKNEGLIDNEQTKDGWFWFLTQSTESIFVVD